MRLSDLHPKWLSPDVLAFDCPKCLNGRDRVTIKAVPMNHEEQLQLFRRKLRKGGLYCHPCKAETCWTFTNADDFELISATPSLNIEGHWHGFVTNGEVRSA